MQTVPLQALANQSLQCQLGGQNCTINIAQMAYGTFCTLTAGGVLIVTVAPCQNLNRIVRDAYIGFAGDLAFVDTQGSSDPVYTGFGTRYQLVYLSAADLATLGLSG